MSTDYPADVAALSMIINFENQQRLEQFGFSADTILRQILLSKEGLYEDLPDVLCRFY